MQNLFIVAKKVNNIHLFRNSNDLSDIQLYFLSMLFLYENLNQEIEIEHITDKVLTNDLYAESYLLWKRNKKEDNTKSDFSHRHLHLVPTNKINFNKKEGN